MKVELGAGGKAQPGWLALDVNPQRCDVVGDARALPFADQSVAALRAVDVLEHVSYRDTDAMLAEWARVCAAGAELYVQVPDAELIMHWYVQRDRRLTTPPDLPQTALAGAAWRLLGGHADGERVDDTDDWRWNAHYAFFSERSLAESLARAGFRVAHIRTNPFPNLCCQAVRR